MNPLRARARPSLLRQMNERMVLAAIQRHGPLSRAEIVRLTGISGPTVTRAVASLLVADLLEEGDSRQAALGRPSKALRLAGARVSVLGAVVGAHRCEVVASGLDGAILPQTVRSFATPARYADLVASFARRVADVTRDLGTTVLGLGVCIPGLLHGAEKRTVLSPNLHQTDGRQLGRDLQEATEHDVNLVQESDALCLAEKMFGAARGVDDFAMLDISDGLGLGVVHKGRVLEGHSGLAGELGHITVQLDGRPCGCGNRGCLETVATDAALSGALSRRLGRTLDIDDVVADVAAGRLDVGPEFEETLQYLAVGLAAVVNIFNPRRLFIHGRFLDARADLFERLVKLTAMRALAPSMADCEIIRARGNKRQAAIAAALHPITSVAPQG